MNAITETQAVSAQTLEHVLGSGDLSKLTTGQRVEYYAKTCQTLGLNPLTRPFRFLTLNGQIQLYATRDCTDQLRKVHGITLHVVDKQIDGDLFIVTVRARTKDGREDEDIGAVTLGRLQGESRANALMKGLTKAKRRVTLSVCGLGLTDESELETMPGAMTFDADAPSPAPIRIEPEPQPQKLTWSQHAEALEIAERDTPDSGVGLLLAKAEVGELYRLAKEGKPSAAKQRILDVMHKLEARYLSDPPAPEPEDDAPEIAGQDKVFAG